MNESERIKKHVDELKEDLKELEKEHNWGLIYPKDPDHRKLCESGRISCEKEIIFYKKRIEKYNKKIV